MTTTLTTQIKNQPKMQKSKVDLQGAAGRGRVLHGSEKNAPQTSCRTTQRQ